MKPGGGASHRVLALESGKQELADDVGVELVGEVDAAVFTDECGG